MILLATTIPIRLTSEANAHEHWRKRNRRVQGQHLVTKSYLRAAYNHRWLVSSAGPLDVIVTRVAPCKLDEHDNLPTSAKHVIDACAAWLGINDKDSERCRYTVVQRKGKVREYAVEVEIAERDDVWFTSRPRSSGWEKKPKRERRVTA